LSIPFVKIFSARAKMGWLDHPIKHTDLFINGIGNLAIDPTTELSARVETNKCFLFCFNLAIDDEIFNNPFFFGTHICA
jgi:hypothetical protein